MSQKWCAAGTHGTDASPATPAHPESTQTYAPRAFIVDAEHLQLIDDAKCEQIFANILGDDGGSTDRAIRLCLDAVIDAVVAKGMTW